MPFMQAYAQEPLQGQAVIRPLHADAAVKPMLASVVQAFDGNDVHYDQPRHTLRFTGTQAVQPQALAVLLAAHHFELLWWEGPQGPELERTPAAGTAATDWTPLDAEAARKNAWIAEHPDQYRQLTGRSMPTPSHADH